MNVSDNKSLVGKKLLILGGNVLSEDIVKEAKRMGLHTIVTDWNSLEDSPAKLIADEYWQESILDLDKLSDLIRIHKIDGVITGFTDSYLVPYAQLCERNSLPSYATSELFEKTINKASFKKMCVLNDVPIVPEYSVDDFDVSIISNSNKIIIKPVDNSGSRGIIICDDPSKYSECLSYALRFSKRKQIIIEKYIEMDSISVSYTIQDGVPSLTTVNDDYLFKTPNKGAVNCGGLYPSKYIDFYLNKMDKKVKTMFVKEGFKNGVLFMQAFTNGRDIYFFEMGYRLSGGRHYVFTEKHNNTSSLNQLIYFAITGRMADYDIAQRDNAKFDYTSIRFNLIGRSGVVDRIEGLDFLEKHNNVIHVSLKVREGEEVGEIGTTASQLVGVYVIMDNKKQFDLFLKDVYDNVRFIGKEKDSNVLVNLVERINIG